MRPRGRAWRASAALVALGPGQRLGQRQRLLLGEHVLAQPAARDVVPIKKPGLPAVAEAHFEAAALRNGFVLDDADVGGHRRQPFGKLRNPQTELSFRHNEWGWDPAVER